MNRERDNDIFLMRINKITYREISEKYGISATRIREIVKRRNWEEEWKAERLDYISPYEGMAQNNWPIHALSLSNRSLNALKNMGIRTVGDITKVSADDLLRAKNLGRGSLNEIVMELSEHGKKLKEESMKYCPCCGKVMI